MELTTGVAVIAALAMLAGFLMMLAGRAMRAGRGLAAGKTVSLDQVTLRSQRLGLTGRPDRLIKAEGTIMPEEWKSSRTLRPWHRAQMGVYFVLIEEELRIRPPHGFIICGDGTRHRIENDDRLRAWVLELAGQIRVARGKITVPIPVSPKPGQCRPCGLRAYCGQAGPEF